jgi:hypothetical protein
MPLSCGTFLLRTWHRLAGLAVPGRRSGAQAHHRSASRDDLPEVRAWLAGHRYPIKDRGRINDVWLADYDTKSPNPPRQADEGDKQPKRKVTTVTAPLFQAV